MNYNKRVVSFDISRFFCMLWIVAIWHGKAYIAGYEYALKHPFWSDLTYGALVTFVFLSGYLNGKKKIESNMDIKQFYKKRILSLYLPFALSATLMLIMFYVWHANYIVSIKQYILSLLGLSLIIQPAPQTIWFVVLLIPYYAITPFILKSKKRIHFCLILYFFLVVFQGLMAKYLNPIDSRIVLYFPVYCVGLCWPNDIENRYDFIKLMTYLILVVFFEFIDIHRDSPYRYILSYCLCGVILETSKLITCEKHIAKIAGLLGAISMNAFLFHRQYFYMINRLSGQINMRKMYLYIIPTFFALLIVIQFLKKIMVKHLKGLKKP